MWVLLDVKDIVLQIIFWRHISSTASHISSLALESHVPLVFSRARDGAFRETMIVEG